MIGYIRKRDDLSITLLNVMSYNVFLNSVERQASKIVAQGIGVLVNKGDFVICDGFNGVIKQVEVEGRVMTLTCESVDAIFDRPLYLDPNRDLSGFSTESFLMAEIIQNFKLCDEMYSYQIAFDASNAPVTPFFLPELSEKNMYNLSDYIKAARRAGVVIDYELNGERLVVVFGSLPTQPIKIDFNANNTVTSEVYGGYSIAKVTNYIDGLADDYYLLSDGTVTHDQSAAGRVFGAWEVLNDANEDTVLKKFNTEYGHEIVFSSKKRLPFLGPLVLKMKSGRVVDSFVSSIKKTNGSDKYEYTAGELKTSLTAKLKK